MKFAIRDDDTNFFTKPKELEHIFNRIWNRCPISLAVVPFHSCTKTNQIPKKYWSGNKLFPIDKNNQLIKFLKQKIKEEKIDILLHGYNHKIETNGFEFELNKELYNHYLTPTNINKVLSEFYFSRKFNGNFCIATHYWELKKDYKLTFDRFINEVFNNKDIKFCK